MNENSDLLPNLAAQEDAFEVQLRGYSRRQVDEFVARCRGQVRELEERLGRSLDDSEQLRQEVKALRQQALGNRPAHEEVSERISQILKLADDEAKAQKTRADGDIKKQLADAQQEADGTKKEARDQAEHMLTAAQEQAERAISAARAEADKTRNTARAESEHATAEARKKADSVLSGAKAQAKQTLNEATARATAIHDGAERRLNLLSTRHAETIRRLTEILDGVSGLVAAETARLTLEDEVDQNVAKAIAQKAAESAAADQARAQGGSAPSRNLGPGTPGGDPAAAAAGNQRGIPGNGTAGQDAPRPTVGARTETSPAGPGRTGPSMAGVPAPARSGSQPADPAQPGQEPPHSGRGADEAPRGARPPAPGASPQGGPAGPGAPAGDRLGPGTGNGQRTGQADGSVTGSIDPDEATEGVRIVREQRKH
jgi:cell division septum initiation protein DivIVA